MFGRNIGSLDRAAALISELRLIDSLSKVG